VLGLRKIFSWGGVKKKFLQLCENPERYQKISQKCHFLAKKVESFFKNAIFSGVRVGRPPGGSLKQKNIGGGDTTLSPPPLSP
jgi:hypothetical protein